MAAIEESIPEDTAAPPYAREAADVVAEQGSDLDRGLAGGEAAARLGRYGPNEITAEKPPALLAVALGQLRNPMNIMLIAVTVVSLAIGQASTAVIVGLLILLNVVLGTRQELKARASIDALSSLQVPQARVLRDGSVMLVPAVEVVPGDVVQLEAGDIVPADGRIVRSATLETQEAALTGESAPIPKDPSVLATADVALGDRTNMVFQSTAVTRGTASVVVTATGMQTQMGQIATMLTSVTRTRSPLQKELDSLTKVLGIIAWGAVAFIVVVGVARGQSFSDVLLLGTAMAISAIPTGMPAFVSGLLSMGAKQLADAKAVVKNLTDVETLGATSAINTDKTGTLTLNEMMVSTLYANGSWFHVEGEGYRKTGAIRSVAGVDVPDFTRLAYGLVLDSDATVSDDGAVVGDPTEAALVVLAAKLGVDAEESRRAYPRLAEVPFDSEYKFMATFHHVPVEGRERAIVLVKGAPDVVLARCAGSGGPLSGSQVPIAEARDGIDGANARMGEDGLRVLAFAARLLDDGELAAMESDPMSLTRDLGFVGLAGIIDPLRPEAKNAVEVALGAGIDVRMITGDHAVTARAIGEQLGLGAGAISGAELAQLSDEELVERLPELHVFGRVTPQDKLRLAQLMQEQGLIVAMTGDAVNDAAALKQADIGVAMGSGSEVTKQAGRMILTDDNFGTLVHAVEIGRRVYDKVSSYVRYQMTQLLALVFLFLAATVFDVNEGVALTPLQVLYLLLFATAAGVVVIAVDPGDPDVMHRPPRDPKLPITNRGAVTLWVVYALALFGAAFVPLVAGPDEPSTDSSSASLTMTFAVMGLGTVFNALTNRRDPVSGFSEPLLKAVGISLVPLTMIVLATELPGLQKGLLTTSLTGHEWLACLALAAVLPIVVEASKWLRRRDLQPPAALDPRRALAPSRAAPMADERHARGDGGRRLVTPSPTPAIVPRWEWRTFADDLALTDPAKELTPGEVRESDEVYCLSASAASVKFRDDVVDVKVLEQVDDAGLERWRPVLKAALPLSADDAGVLLHALDVTPLPQLDRTSYGLEELRGLLRGRADVHVVDVHKTRRHFRGGGCRVELTTVRVGDAVTETIAVESEDEGSVSALVERLGFPLRPNVSVPRGLEQLARRSTPRYAVIDVGTNSVKLHLADRAADGQWHTVVDRAEVTRLGEGLDDSGLLQPEPMRRTLEAIAGMVAEARRRGARSIAAVGTAWMRIARNADELVALVQERTGVGVEVISGEDESRLAYLAVKAGIGLSEGTIVVFDTGGGSSQFTFGTGERVDERFSLDVGAVRFTERFGLDGPVDEDVLSAALDAIAEDLTRLDGRRRPEALVALGGVVTNLAAVKHALARYDPDVVQGTALDRAEIDRQIELYRTGTADERRTIVGLQPGRAEVILAGACVVRSVMEKLACASLVVSDRGLRHGVLLERFGGAPTGARPADARP